MKYKLDAEKNIQISIPTPIQGIVNSIDGIRIGDQLLIKFIMSNLARHIHTEILQIENEDTEGMLKEQLLEHYKLQNVNIDENPHLDPDYFTTLVDATLFGDSGLIKVGICSLKMNYNEQEKTYQPMLILRNFSLGHDFTLNSGETRGSNYLGYIERMTPEIKDEIKSLIQYIIESGIIDEQIKFVMSNKDSVIDFIIEYFHYRQFSRITDIHQDAQGHSELLCLIYDIEDDGKTLTASFNLNCNKKYSERTFEIKYPITGFIAKNLEHTTPSNEIQPQIVGTPGTISAVPIDCDNEDLNREIIQDSRHFVRIISIVRTEQDVQLPKFGVDFLKKLCNEHPEINSQLSMENLCGLVKQYHGLVKVVKIQRRGQQLGGKRKHYYRKTRKTRKTRRIKKKKYTKRPRKRQYNRYSNKR